jgi:hypothetical protein
MRISSRTTTCDTCRYFPHEPVSPRSSIHVTELESQLADDLDIVPQREQHFGTTKRAAGIRWYPPAGSRPCLPLFLIPTLVFAFALEWYSPFVVVYPPPQSDGLRGGRPKPVRRPSPGPEDDIESLRSVQPEAREGMSSFPPSLG